MEKRTKLPVVVGATILAIAVAVWVFMPSGVKEPEYEGRTLSEWLERVNATKDSPGSAPYLEATAAIRSIGTNGFPVVME